MAKSQRMIIATAAALLFANAVSATSLHHRGVSVAQVDYVVNSCSCDPCCNTGSRQYYNSERQNYSAFQDEHPYPYSDLRDDSINNHFGDPENYPYHIQ